MQETINYITNCLKNVSPQDLVMNLANQTNNPVINQLIALAKSGNEKGVEEFAKNFLNERNREFNAEFSEFMKKVK